MTRTAYEHALDEAVHEVADIVVNFGGYADDAAESDARADKRERIERAIHALLAAAK